MGQPQDDLRKNGDAQQQGQEHHQKQPTLANHLANRYTGQRFGHEQQHAKGRMDQANHHVEHHQHPKVHQVHPQQLGGWQQHGHKHQQQHRHIQKTTQDQKQGIDHEQKLQAAQLQSIDPLRHALGHAFSGEGVIQHERTSQNNGDHRAGTGGLQNHRPKSSPTQRLEHPGRQHQRVQCRHRRRFSRGECARVNATEQHDGHGQGQGTACNDLRPHGARHGVFAGHVAPVGDEVHHGHHQQSHAQAGQQATQKQSPHRSARDQGVNHHGNGRRNDGAQGGAGHHHGTGKATRVPGLGQHLADGHQAWACRIGNGTATHPRKHHADQNVHLRQTTAHAADQHAAKIKNALAHRACVHQVGGKHKHGHCQQHIAVVQTVAHLLGHQPQVLPLDPQVSHPRHQHRKPNGHAQQHAHDHHAAHGHEGGAHGAGALSSRLWPRKAWVIAHKLRITKASINRTNGINTH